jgi:hypothetical protein
MFMKLLLTALVIGGAILALRLRGQGAPAIRAGRPTPRPPAPRSPLPRLAAYGLMVIMLGAAGLYLYHQWRDAYQVVTVRVIDTRSGNTMVYQAYKGDVTGRSFETVDGRSVTLAEVERLELGGD